MTYGAHKIDSLRAGVDKNVGAIRASFVMAVYALAGVRMHIVRMNTAMTATRPVFL